MLLYLRNDLLKSEGDKKPSKSGEQRGGSYVARAQIGADKDGSPKYRYFKTQDEYETYLQGHKSGKELDTKVKQEHKESTEKQHGLLSRDKNTEKSLRLYVRT